MYIQLYQCILLNFQAETYVIIKSSNTSTKTVRKKVDFVNYNMRTYQEKLISIIGTSDYT